MSQGSACPRLAAFCSFPSTLSRSVCAPSSDITGSFTAQFPDAFLHRRKRLVFLFLPTLHGEVDARLKCSIHHLITAIYLILSEKCHGKLGRPDDELNVVLRF